MAFFRKNKGLNQKLYLIESIIDETKIFERTYIVMGSTGNVYNVIINNKPICTCPDYATRKNRCKHIYFILLRIMRTENEDQTEYSNVDLLNMYSNIPQIINNFIIDPIIKIKYNNIKNSDNNNNNNNNNKIILKPTDDICPICLDDLENGSELDFCKNSCGKSLHKDCFMMWIKSKGATCIFCRANWNSNDDSKYINLL